MNIQVRSGTSTDCAFILEMIQELAAFEKLSSQVVATEELLRLELFGPDPKAFVLIALENTEPVGFALYFYNFSTFLAKPGIYLEDLYVKESKRSKGVGLKILNSLAKIATDKGCGRLEWSVLNWNQKAIDFYLSLDAKPMNEWTVYRMDESAISKLQSS